MLENKFSSYKSFPCIKSIKNVIGGMELEDDLKPKLLAENAYKIFP